ncbi:MAG TPA: EI24 domain-containing protein [Burkholderiales bacterium]|nr:EI24 domain-containing protein [Burkholderiales bacterium]
MKTIIKAIQGAIRSLVHPIILAVMLVPMGVAVAVWLLVAWLAWGPWSRWVQGWVAAWTPASWTARWDLDWLGTASALAAAVLVIAPLVIGTSLLIATLFAMPVLLKHVGDRNYPGLERRHGGTMAGSLANALAAIAGFLVLWLLVLPFWLFAPIGALLSLLLSARLNQRLFRYDALSEHASADEMREVVERTKGRLLLLGLATGLLYFVPVVNLVAPTFAALAFIHFCLHELAELRRAGGEA